MKTVPVSERELAGTLKVKAFHCASHECGKFLGYQAMVPGMLSIACHRCKSINLVTTYPEDLPVPKTLTVVRCARCGRKLYDEAILDGVVKVKCYSCHTWQTLDIQADGAIIESDMVEEPIGSS